MLNTYEIRRKIFHVFSGITITLLINNIEKNILLVSLIILLVIAIILSVIVKYLKPSIITYLLKLFDKPKDFEKFPGKGAIYFLIGTLITIFFFEKNIASASIMILTFGDPFAHIIARYYGKTKLIINEKKVLEGTIAGIIAGTIAASLFIPWQIAFFGSCFGMIAEAIELEFLNWDDNFYIPVVAGFVITIIKKTL
ncbi:MAG: SEC59/DGK1/VTE5 family protein [Candidatus Woesearchaeota archaeon]